LRTKKSIIIVFKTRVNLHETTVKEIFYLKNLLICAARCKERKNILPNPVLALKTALCIPIKPFRRAPYHIASSISPLTTKTSSEGASEREAKGEKGERRVRARLDRAHHHHHHRGRHHHHRVLSSSTSSALFSGRPPSPPPVSFLAGSR